MQEPSKPRSISFHIPPHAYRALLTRPSPELSEEDKLIVSRARKLERFFSQPFYVAQQFTGKEGKYVKLADSLKSFDEICNGGADSLPEQAFLYVGGLDEVREKAKQMAIIMGAAQDGNRDIPDYLNVDSDKLKGTFTRAPVIADVPYPVQMEPNLVIEFYSR